MTANAPGPATVLLTWFEVMQAGTAGICRYMKAVEKARPQRYGEVSTNRWAADIEGCLGEQVLAKFTGRYWDGALRDEARPGDVGDIEARHSTYPGAHLCIHRGDADDHIFVLVTGSLAGRAPYPFQVVGWTSGAHGKREDWWGDIRKGLGRPAYWVPQAMLHPPHALKEYTPEELRKWPAKGGGEGGVTKRRASAPETGVESSRLGAEGRDRFLGRRSMVVSGRKLGLLAAVGLFLVALLPAACTWDEGDVYVTSSTATLPASEPAFHRELSGPGYHTVMVHTVPEGAQGWTPPGRLGRSNTAVMEVLVWVDPAKETRATYNLIYDHATTLAKKYGIADSTGGQLRVVLFDAGPGEFIGEHVIDSRDIDLTGGEG